ncbi:hypothetical protein CISIN_1g038215mg [Citrus sinensis]|uniref:Uncharacterized protein n=1 Tax=Citrus sinensis TaxID=2711 RepID=A0A067E296_CITSI|nr:hypothetical protein CISIN_1g038215mg [Citrus sinensis]
MYLNCWLPFSFQFSTMSFLHREKCRGCVHCMKNPKKSQSNIFTEKFSTTIGKECDAIRISCDDYEYRDVHDKVGTMEVLELLADFEMWNQILR